MRRSIGVDWGTSNFRAFLLDAAGRDSSTAAPAPHGIMTVTDGDFAARACRAQIGDWLAGEARARPDVGHDRQPPGLGRGALRDDARPASPTSPRRSSRVPFDGAELRIVAGLKPPRPACAT